MMDDSRLSLYLSSASTVKQPKTGRKIPKLGYLRDTAYGETWVVDWFYEEGDLYGGQEIRKSGFIQPIIDPPLGQFDLSAATVIDTETTGLAGGTGTYAFIIGSGFWQGSTFVVRQYMMRDFNEEPAQLTAFAEDLTSNLVSYNGKCFDLPLLRNRFLLHRFDSPLDKRPHLDMLFPSRRLWKRSLRGFKLSQLENSILGYARSDDIPSHLIPSIFFDYLQSQDETVLYPILHHNRDDIVSLHQIAAIASDSIRKAFDIGGNDDELLLSLAGLYFKQGNYNTAIDLIEKMNRKFLEPQTAKDSLLLRSLSYKKLGLWENAVASFLELHKLEPDFYSSTELAKLHEHKLKNPEKALEFVARIETELEFQASLENESVPELASLRHRKRRLKKKLAGSKS